MVSLESKKYLSVAGEQEEVKTGESCAYAKKSHFVGRHSLNNSWKFFAVLSAIHLSAVLSDIYSPLLFFLGEHNFPFK